MTPANTEALTAVARAYAIRANHLRADHPAMSAMVARALWAEFSDPSPSGRVRCPDCDTELRAPAGAEGLCAECGAWVAAPESEGADR